MIGCRLVEMWRWWGIRVGAGARRLEECVNDMKVLGLQPEWVLFRDMWRGFISGQTFYPS